MSASTLKIIALITMIIDHIGGALFPQFLFLRVIGRIAFPIYAFFIAQGCIYTKDYKKYLSRLFIFALVSEIPYDLCFNTYPNYIKINFLNQTNTIYTLFLGAFLIFVFIKLEDINISYFKKLFIKIISCIFILFISIILQTDYSAWGIILILTFYLFRNDKMAMLLIPLLLIIYKYVNYFNFSLFLFNILPLGLLYFYNNKKGINLKWLFYIGYPLHLLIIGLIRILINF